MKYTQLYTGIEIECILNERIHDFTPDNYNSNGRKISKRWSLKHDASIHPINTNFEVFTDAEFISCVLKTPNEFNKAIDEFIKLLSKDGEHELKEVIEINKSCGNHLHLSLSNNKLFNEHIDYEILKEVREHFFKLLENSKKLSKNTKQEVKEHYYRSYSKELKRRIWDNPSNHSPRSLEFNKQSERQNKGLEWRSFNLNSVKDWAEFKEMFTIGRECLELLFKKRTKGYNLKKKKIKIGVTELKRDLEKQNEDVLISLEFKEQPKEIEQEIKVNDNLSDLTATPYNPYRNNNVYADEEEEQEEDEYDEYGREIHRNDDGERYIYNSDGDREYI